VAAIMTERQPRGWTLQARRQVLGRAYKERVYDLAQLGKADAAA